MSKWKLLLAPKGACSETYSVFCICPPWYLWSLLVYFLFKALVLASACLPGAVSISLFFSYPDSHAFLSPSTLLPATQECFSFTLLRHCIGALWWNIFTKHKQTCSWHRKFQTKWFKSSKIISKENKALF